MEQIIDNNRKPLPNASTVLVLGILSIVLGCGVGLILGIIGLIQAKEPKRLYDENPDGWDNYGNLNAGRIMSIIGICLNSVAVVFFVIYFLIIGAILGTAGAFGGF
jgi:hypothetical protein